MQDSRNRVAKVGSENPLAARKRHESPATNPLCFPAVCSSCSARGERNQEESTGCLKNVARNGTNIVSVFGDCLDG